MKKFIICAAAAIVALASCSKTQVVYNDAPEEINFKAVSGVMTKAPVTGTAFPETQDITVYAWNYTGKAKYFGPVDFTAPGAESTDPWKGSTSQYYPTTGSLDFVAYTSNLVVSLTVPSDNGTYNYTLSDNSTAQHDFMVSNYVVGKSSSIEAVAINFTHALALIDINFKCTGQSVKVTKVTLNGTKQQGTVEVTYTEADNKITDNNVAPSIGTWNVTGATAKSLVEDADVALTVDSDFADFAQFLVVPDDDDDNESISITYEINGNEFTDSIDLTKDDTTPVKWETGKKYIYNITIGLEEITFSPTITTDWDNQTPITPSI